MRSILGTLCLVAVLGASSVASAQLVYPYSAQCYNPGIACFTIQNTHTVAGSTSIAGINPGNGYAILGTLTGGSATNGSAVVGDAGVTSGVAVSGITNGPATGVHGVSFSGVGVRAASGNGDGLEATTSSSSKSAVYAHNLNGNGGYGVFATANGWGVAIQGRNTNSSGWAGYFEGKVLATTFVVSDARLKKDVAALTYGLKDVALLRPVTFNWKDPARTERQLGFLAQDIQKVVPEIVDKDAKTGMLSVNYSGLVPVLVKAVQEQQAFIQQQEARISRLEQRPIISSMFSGGINLATAFVVVSVLAFMLVQRRRQRKSQH